MPLLLVIHDLTPEGAEAVEASLWDLSESHWVLPGGMLVATGVSPGYLLSHLRRAVSRAGAEGALIVSEATGALHLDGLTAEARDWIEENLEPPAAEASGQAGEPLPEEREETLRVE